MSDIINIEKEAKLMLDGEDLVVTFRFKTKDIDKGNLTGEDIISVLSDTQEGQSIVYFAGQIVDKYNELKKKRGG